MNTKMKEMKEWLKSTTKEIRKYKEIYKDYQRKHNGEMNHDYGKYHELAVAYRTNHIAYSLAKGNTLEQICRHMKDGKYKKEWCTNLDWFSIHLSCIKSIASQLMEPDIPCTESLSTEKEKS